MQKNENKKTKTKKKAKQTNKKAHTEEMANFLRTYCFLGQINLVILILYARAGNHPPTSTTVYLSQANLLAEIALTQPWLVNISLNA